MSSGLPIPDVSIGFKCPYCSLGYDLWKLIGRQEIILRESVFRCNQYDADMAKAGCGKRFVIDLELTYEIAITELKE